MRNYDAIVIGCGAMGSSASYNLAKRGLRVLTLDRFQPTHELGSSHGKTRITRLAYYEDPRYVPLLRRAFEAWREVERTSGKELLRMTGCLSVGPEDSELVVGVLSSAKAHGLAFKRYGGREAEEAFPAFSIDDGHTAVYEENAGILFPEECVRAFVGLAGQEGCEFGFSEEVTSWRRDGESLTVETRRRTCTADRLIICAGPWMGKLTGGVIPLEVERQVPFWFSSGGERRFSAGEMPVFIMQQSEGIYYGIPDVGHGVKVARHHGGEIVSPDDVRREVGEGDSAPVEAFVLRRLPGLRRPYESAITCLYTDTPDRNFAVGPHPDHPKVVIVSACSGHGFKFSSVMGEVAADLTTDKRPPFDISFLSPDRFRR